MGDNVTVVHAWDPQGVSDFALKYDVLGTPRMFLVDADGFIVGRRLNSEALKRLLGVAEIQRDLASRAPVGTLMPDISVPSTLLTQRKSLSQSAGVHSLRQRSRRTTVVFYTHGCGTCSETLSAAKASLRRRQRALLVDMDEVLSQDSALAATLFDTFDLTVMPKTFVLDRRGRIVAKDNLQSAK